MIKSTTTKEIKSVTNIKKPIMTSKSVRISQSKNVKSSITQYNIQNDSIEDMSLLFEQPYTPSFLTNAGDLANNSQFKIMPFLEHIADHLRIPLNKTHPNTLLDHFYRLIVDIHTVSAFSPSDITRLQYKAYSCIYNYKHLLQLNFIARRLPLSAQDLNRLQSRLSYINARFSMTNKHSRAFSYVLTTPYEESTKECLSWTFNQLGSFHGLGLDCISLIQKIITPMIDVQLADVSENTLSFDTFLNSFLVNLPVTLIKKGDAIYDPLKAPNIFATDLDFLPLLVGRKQLPENFLKEDPQQRSVLLQLRVKLLVFLRTYYYYCVIQKPSQLTVPMSILCDKLNHSNSLKIPFIRMEEVLNSPKLSNTMFTNFTKILVDCSFIVSTFLVWNMNVVSFVNEFNSLNRETFKSREELIRQLESDVKQREDFILTYVKNKLLTEAKDIVSPVSTVENIVVPSIDTDVK